MTKQNRGATLLTTSQELQSRVGAVAANHPLGLGLVDQYYFDHGKQTDAVKAVCGDQGDQCKIDTAPYRDFQKWLDHTVVVGPYVPANLADRPALDPTGAAQVQLCKNKNPGIPCGYGYFASVINADSDRIGELEPSRQHGAFKVFRDHLDGMNTMDGVPAFASLPPAFQHSTFDVINALKKNRPAFATLIECPDKRKTGFCVFSVTTTIGDAAGGGHFYGKRAIARANVVMTQPHPTKPGEEVIEFLWLDKANIELTLLSLRVVEVVTYPQTSSFSGGGTWATFYSPKSPVTDNIAGPASLGKENAESAYVIVQDLKSSLKTNESDFFVNAEGFGEFKTSLLPVEANDHGWLDRLTNKWL